MRPRRGLWMVGVCVLPSAVFAHGEDAGAPPPEVNPMSVVVAARGSAAPVLNHTRRHRRAQPWEETLRMPLERGRCYELVGYATGAAPVFAQVIAGRARVGDSLAMTATVPRAARQRFCAREEGSLYSLEVRAEGESWWYLAVVPTGERVESAPASTAAQAPDANVRPRAQRPSTERFPVGGDDYVGRQVQAFARQREGLTGLTAMTRTTLATNGAWESRIEIASGRCVDVVAAGVPSVADLVVELEDPAGHRVAQDATRRNVESIRHCAPYAGTFRLRVRVFSGAGLVGVQALEEP